MKIILLMFNSKYIHSSLAPWCLKAGVEEYSKAGHSCTVFESTINAPLAPTLSELLNEAPDMVGLCSYIWNIERVLEAAKEIKAANPRCKILLGGPEVSYNAEEVLKNNSAVDFVISGEGELPLARLCDALSLSSSLEGIEGLSFKKEDGEIFLSAPFSPDFEPPGPYCEEYFASLAGRIAYIEGSRGCPFSCAFCLSSIGSGARHFSLERIKREILLLSQSGTKTVKFVDRTFNANRKRADEILEFILLIYGKEIPKGVCFHFEIAGDILRESTLSLLSKFPKGALQLEIGLQSFNEETLAAINRKTNTSRLLENIKKLRAMGNIHLHIDLIAGLKGEGLASFEESFNTAFSLGCDMLQLGFLKLLHGAEMRENPEKFPCSFSPLPPYEVLETPELSKEELKALKLGEDALDRLYNSGRFKRTLNYLTGDCGLNPFRLFLGFGARVSGENMPLLKYFEKVYRHFSSFERVDKQRLRDMLLFDRLVADSTAALPEALKIPDKRLAKYKREYSERGKKIGLGILYSEGKLLKVSYEEGEKKWRIPPRVNRFRIISKSLGLIFGCK